MTFLVARDLFSISAAENESHLALCEARFLAICPQIVFELVGGHRGVRSSELRLFARRLDENGASNETGDLAGSGKKEKADKEKTKLGIRRNQRSGKPCNLLKPDTLEHKTSQLSNSVLLIF